MEAVARELAHFFQAGVLTASYKPVILRAILHLLWQQRIHRVGNWTLIVVEEIVRYFFRFNFVLYHRFHLRQSITRQKPAHVYRIIGTFFLEIAKRII